MASLASRASSTSFQDLVPDIKIKIIKFAVQKSGDGPEIDLKVARSLSLVNKELRCLASPMLFERLDISRQSNPELESFFSKLSLGTKQLVQEIIFKGEGPGYKGNGFCDPGPIKVAARRRALATKIIAELPNLVSLNLTLVYDATSFSGLEIYSAINQEMGHRLTKLELRPESQDKKHQLLDPELVASFLRCTPNLVTLSLQDVGLGNGVTLWTAMAKLHQLKTLKLEDVALPPLLPSVKWSAPVKELECWSCPGIDTPLLMKFTSYFSPTLEFLEVGSRDLYEDQRAFYDLPHLKRLRFTAYQPFDHISSLSKNSPLTHLFLLPRLQLPRYESSTPPRLQPLAFRIDPRGRAIRRRHVRYDRHGRRKECHYHALEDAVA
ncbi:hypothetical protein BCR35DRAFT_166133 [Leucosporidium creatinivorum]|uniref:F-box domain-containing protein n=1 Tax=Leucosporidium creatinivorum TaxID=106004 RepID=A0A1Y2EGS9_9BASI|nr:hypothetical protein BCR35DRAFT_166133 [Leucosporidium creatinivorum]